MKSFNPWYVKDKNSLSPQSRLEHILNYGSWADFSVFIKKNGLIKTKEVFKQISDKKRNNLKPKINNYFSLFFKSNAS